MRVGPILALVLLCGCSATPKKETLTIGVAASLATVASEVLERYQAEHPDVVITMTTGSSGALCAQIEQGAPIDLVLSAGVDEVERLGDKVAQVTPLVTNTIVLVSAKPEDYPSGRMEDILTVYDGILGIGEPSSVPSGRYAMEILTHLGLADSLTLNYATDVRQVVAWCESDGTGLGFVYPTDLATAPTLQVVAVPDSSWYSPPICPIAVVTATQNPTGAQDLYQYFTNEATATLFVSHGFDPIEAR